MIEHPDITAAELTGYPRQRQNGLRCRLCGCIICEDEPYYDLEDWIYCPNCLAKCLRYG